MLRCSDDSLYTGITPNLQRRMRQHTGQLKGGARYTALRPPKEIAALWTAPDRAAASKGEYAIKRLTPEQKRELVRHPEQINALTARNEPIPLEICEIPQLTDLIK